MTITTRVESLAPAHQPTSLPGFATVGTAGARLLSGPPDREELRAHERRLGPLPVRPDSDSVLDIATTAHVVGRGGGEFPLARKLTTALSARGEPVVVVNGAESEPASRKDRLLLQRRPHLVLDGAQLAAAAVGARHVVVYVHRDDQRLDHNSSEMSITAAIRERGARDEAPMALRTGPSGFVTGESSAVVAALEGRRAVPRPHAEPVAMRGLHGHPTVVSNPETLAHLALAFRFGAMWFRAIGSADAPGSTLLTLAGGAATSGLVVETLSAATFGALLTGLGGLARPPRAVLLGGYGGRWLSGPAAWDTVVDRALLKRVGVPLGCGLVAPLPDDACGLEVTARLLNFLSGQSARQCGSCLFGLPRLAELFDMVVRDGGTRGDVKRLREVAHTVEGRGGCAHPDGATALLETALEVFADDVRAHLKGRHCGRVATGWFPLLPDAAGGLTR